MKRIILFLPLLLLIYVNSQAGNKDGKSTLAFVADFNASVRNGCVSLTTRFTSTSTFNAGDPIVSYSWNFGDGTPLGTTASPTHTYTTQGFYTVSLTIQSQSGATVTETKNDYIFAGNKPVFDFGADYSVCEGSGQITLSTVTGPYIYTWSDPSITTWQANFTPVAGTVNTYWGKADNNGCSTSDTIRITSKELITAKWGYEVTGSCGVVSVQFTDSSTFATECDPGNDIDVLYWEFGDGVDGFGSNVSHDFTTGGPHTVTLYVYDVNGESVELSKTINLPNPTPGPAPIDFGGDKTICLGNSVQLDAGYEAGATYEWTPATGLSSTTAYNPVASPTSTQVYTVTKTKCGVDISGSVTVNVSPALTVNLGPDQDFCAGFIILDAGVTGASQYKWGSNYLPSYYAAQTGQTIFATGAGTYWVAVTKNGCTARDTVVLRYKKPVTAAFNYTQSGSGSCGPYVVNVTENSTYCLGTAQTHVWNFGDGTVISGYNQTLSHTYSTPGTYNITLIITNTGNAKDTISHSVTYTGSGFSVNLGNDTTICAGNSVTLDAGAGSSYAWSTGATTRTITVTPASTTTYSVTVTSSLGCTATDSKIVTVGTGFTVSLGADRELCPSGSIVIDAGNAPATYKWYTDNGIGYYNTRTTQVLNVSHGGTYWVEVTKNGCKAYDTLAVTMKKPVTGSFTYTQSGSGTCGPYVVNVSENSTFCTGSAADHVWNFGDGTIVSGFNQSYSHTYSSAGTYTVTMIITNTGGSKDTVSHTITYAGSSFSVDLGTNESICAGNSVTIDAGPGVSYAWSTGETTRTITVSPAATTTYSVTVTNNIGCTASGSKTVTVGSNLSVNLGSDTTICSGSSVTLDAGAGSSYAWSTGAITRTITVSPTVNTNYSVTVTNAAGCTGTGSRNVNIAAAVSVNLGSDTTICSGSSVTLDAGAGASYAWSTGATTRTITVSPTANTNYSVTVTNASGCTGTGSRNVNVAAAVSVSLGSDTTICSGSSVTLDAGAGASYAWSTGAATRTITVSPTANTNYSVTVTNASGCTGTGSRNVNVAAAVSVNLGSDTTICSGSSVTLDAGAGASYAWSTGATTRTITVSPTANTNYSVTVTNASGCTGTGSRNVNVAAAVSVSLGSDTTICSGSSVTLDAGAGASYTWSTGATTRTITVSPTANTNYSVTVTNASGCTGSASRNVNVAAVVNVNLGSDITICSGSSVTLDAGAGASYIWSTGATTRTITVSPTANTNYSVTVTNAAGCTVTGSRNVNVGATGVLSIGSDTTICSGNSITLDAGAGASYAWSTGATTRTISVSPTANTNYSVTVTNASGCTATGSRNVNVGAALTVNLGADTSYCPGGYITLMSGVSGATYLWGSTYPSTAYNGRTTQNLNVLHAGKFWVTVTKGGCVGRDTIDVRHKDTLVAKFNTVLAGSGSCGPYTVTVTENSDVCLGSVATHSWDFGDGTIITGFNKTYSHQYTNAGDHTIRLIVTTSGGTKDTVDHLVNFAGSPFTVNLGNDTTICTGGSLMLNAGNPGATYAWSTGETGQIINVSTSGSYYVEVNNGLCKARDTIQVTISNVLNINLGNDTTICPLNSVTLDAGHPGATYLWSANAGNATGQTVTVSPDDPENVYTVTVSQGGCSGTASITVRVNSSLPVNLGNDTTICAGSYITFDAGYPGATYLWSNGPSSQTNTVYAAGTYKVHVTYNGCVGEDSIRLALIDPPAPVKLGDDINSCFGNSVVLDAGDYTGASYLWSTGATSRTITVSSSGAYHVMVSGCSVTVRDTINVTMGNLSAPTITQSGLELVCTQADTYQWYKDGVLIPGATSQRYKARGYGNYSVRVTNATLGCSGQSASYWFVPDGDVYLGDIKVKVTPNPSAGHTNLVLSKVPQKSIKVSIYDRIGRRLSIREVSNTVTNLNLTMYAKGLYFVECVLDNNRVILPLITQ